MYEWAVREDIKKSSYAQAMTILLESVQATQDPQAISNTLAPFMALANTTSATRCAPTSCCCA